jgi:hypothetical protein
MFDELLEVGQKNGLAQSKCEGVYIVFLTHPPDLSEPPLPSPLPLAISKSGLCPPLLYMAGLQRRYLNWEVTVDRYLALSRSRRVRYKLLVHERKRELLLCLDSLRYPPVARVKGLGKSGSEEVKVSVHSEMSVELIGSQAGFQAFKTDHILCG